MHRSPQHSPTAPQAWLTEIHEYAQKDVVIMLLGNKVCAGCPFTLWFAVLCCASPALAIPMAMEGWGSVGASCLHPLLGSGALWAHPGPEVTPEILGVRRV